jgi:macrolide-specific efflux system membrane fusion protein
MTVTQPTRTAGRQQRARRRWVVITLTVVAVVVITGIIAGSLLGRDSPGPTGTTVVVRVLRGDQVTSVSVAGTLQPTRRAQLSFGTAGTVTSVRVKVGDRVSTGDVVARIDDAELADAVDLASANLNAARAQLEQARDADASSSALAAARAQVTSASARLSSARLALRKATLRSPMKGIVAAVNIEEGDAITPGGSSTSTISGTSRATGHLVIVSTASWTVEATAGAADVGSLTKGQPARVTITGTERVVAAKVDTIGIVGTATGNTAVFPLTLKVSGKPTGLYSGMSVSATITTASVPAVLTVPTAAVIEVDGKPGVLKVVGGATIPTTVGIGRQFGDRTEITSGLDEGDQIQLTLQGAGPVPGGDPAGGKATVPPGEGGPPAPPTSAETVSR